MYVAHVSSLAALGSLRTAWNQLAGGVPFRSWDWLEAWWRHYGVRSEPGQGLELFVLAIYDDDQQVRGIAPWYLADCWGQGRVVRWLGSGEACSEYLSLLIEPGWSAQVLDVLTTWLCDKRLGGGRRPLGDATPAWDALALDGVANDDLLVAELAERLTWFGCPLERRPGMGCWRLELPADWEQYLASLSKSHRKQVRRIERRVLASGRAQWHMVRQLSELSQAFEVLVDLHQRRRASLGEPGSFHSLQFTSFHREATRRLLAEGQLRLHWLELDGQPVAAEYALAGGGILYAYQSGLSPEAIEEEPGRVSAVALLQQAQGDGFRAVDFLRGDEPYKAHWRAEPRPTYDWRIAAPRWTARVRHRAWITGQETRRLSQHGLSWLSARFSPATSETAPQPAAESLSEPAPTAGALPVDEASLVSSTTEQGSLI